MAGKPASPVLIVSLFFFSSADDISRGTYVAGRLEFTVRPYQMLAIAIAYFISTYILLLVMEDVRCRNRVADLEKCRSQNPVGDSDENLGAWQGWRLEKKEAASHVLHPCSLATIIQV